LPNAFLGCAGNQEFESLCFRKNPSFPRRRESGTCQSFEKTGFPFSWDPLAERLKARGSRHSGQAKRDPESRIFEHFWIPAFAGVTE